MSKFKLDNKTKRMIRGVSNALPTYHETFHKRRHIHNKEIETKGIEPDNYNKEKQYQYSYYNGKRIIDAKAHYNRMCNAWKNGGVEGYRAYLIEFNKKEFRHASLWNRFLSKLNMN